MRPRSLVGPLLLIALGILLLLQTLSPQFPLWEIAAQYWPLVLIAWGGLRLIEILVWWLRGLPLPTSGLSGGEWTLVVIVCLLGSGLHAAHRYRPWDRLAVVAGKRVELFGRTYEFPIAEQVLPARRAPRVLIENLRGATRIKGVEAQELRVRGHKTVRALENSEASETDSRTALELSAEQDRIVIRTNLDRAPAENRVSADIEVVLPKGAEVEVHAREGDLEADSVSSLILTTDTGSVRATNVQGAVRLRLGRAGSVKLMEIGGAAEIVTRRGRHLELEGIRGPVSVEGFYSGDARFANLAGPLRLENPQLTLRVPKLPGHIQMDLGDLSGARLEGPVHFTSQRALDVELDAFTKGGEISLDGGDIRLRPAPDNLGPIRARTRSGDIELALSESASFQLRARTERGSVFNQFGPALRETAEPRGGGLLTGGAAGPLIELETLRGSITVRKDTGPLPGLRKESARDTIEIETGDGRLRIQRH